MFLINESNNNNEGVNAKLKIFGIGGGGSNAITYIYKQNLSHGYLVAANTDKKALSITLAHKKITLGEGLGAGGDPEKGRKAMEDSIEEVKSTLEGTNLLILIATLGGGTGTGGIPVVARLAKDMKILTIGIVTLPFAFEAKIRMTKALKVLDELEETLDTLLVIENQKLIEIAPSDISHKQAFHIADNTLYQAVRGIISIIYQVSYINVDFADLATTIKNGGRAIMGSGTGKGENAIMEAVEEAIDNPLIKDGTMINAKNILVSFTGRENKMPIKKMEEAINYIKERTNAKEEECEVFWGVGSFPYGEEPDHDVEVTIIATRGKEEKTSPKETKEEESSEIPPNRGPRVIDSRGRNSRIPSIFKKKNRKKNKEN